jgi:carbamoyl-phosphate synthase large subunit
MQIVYDGNDLRRYMEKAVLVSPGKPILIDRFLEDATEVDVDAISDGDVTIIGGIMEHIEEAGIHSGDSACVLPPISLSRELIDEIIKNTKAIAKELNVIGLMNIQYAIQKGTIYILEVNPRASRTVPFVSKATGVPLAKLATKVIMGMKLKDLGYSSEVIPVHLSCKESVFPFSRFPGVDTILGPEMKSTGEVMGIGSTFGLAFAKSQLAAGQELPLKGTVFISVKNADRSAVVKPAKIFHELGFRIVATEGTSLFLAGEGIPNEIVKKVREGRPNIVDMIKNREIALVINTTNNKKAISESFPIRRAALVLGVPYTTTIAGAKATAMAIKALVEGRIDVKTIQEYHNK